MPAASPTPMLMLAVCALLRYCRPCIRLFSLRAGPGRSLGVPVRAFRAVLLAVMLPPAMFAIPAAAGFHESGPRFSRAGFAGFRNTILLMGAAPSVCSFGFGSLVTLGMS